jgi:predicted nucleic acid-binding protein
MPAVSSAYVDTSVLGAYYCPEPLSPAAESALQRLNSPVISTLTEVEFASLIARKCRMRELTPGQSRAVLDLFSSQVREGLFHRLLLGPEHFRHARDLVAATTASLRTLDALHLAAAIRENLPLITSDRDFARAARRHGAATVLLT